jgi:hypothetical protein
MLMKKGRNELITAVIKEEIAIKEETAIRVTAIAVDVGCEGHESSIRL